MTAFMRGIRTPPSTTSIPDLLPVQPPFQNADPVAQSEDLDIFPPSLIGSSRSIANAFVTPRYASPSSTTDHHAAPTGAT